MYIWERYLVTTFCIAYLYEESVANPIQNTDRTSELYSTPPGRHLFLPGGDVGGQTFCQGAENTRTVTESSVNG